MTDDSILLIVVSVLRSLYVAVACILGACVVLLLAAMVAEGAYHLLGGLLRLFVVVFGGD